MENNFLKESINNLFYKLNIPILEIAFIDKGINSLVYRIVSDNEVYGLKICQYPE